MEPLVWRNLKLQSAAWSHLYCVRFTVSATAACHETAMVGTVAPTNFNLMVAAGVRVSSRSHSIRERRSRSVVSSVGGCRS